jgi:hypothetical protein
MPKRYIVFIGYYLLLNIFTFNVVFYISALFLYFVATIIFDYFKGGNNHVQFIQKEKVFS